MANSSPDTLKTSSYDVVALHNIDSDDFVFEYDRSQGNYPHVIPAGEIKRFPRFLAEHALKHLIDKILTKQKVRTSNEEARRNLAEQIVVEEEVIQQAPVKAPAEILKEEVDRLNRPSELEMVLKKHRDAKKEEINTPPPVTEAGEIKPEDEEKFAGLGPPIDTTDANVSLPVEEVKPVPTRNEIYDYARNKMGMTFNDETQKKLDKMKIDELLVELGDPRESLV